jgi:hypothetical protein
MSRRQSSELLIDSTPLVSFLVDGALPAERLKTISDNTARLRAYNASALDAAHAQLSKFVEEWATAKVGNLTRPLSKPLYSPP